MCWYCKYSLLISIRTWGRRSWSSRAICPVAFVKVVPSPCSTVHCRWCSWYPQTVRGQENQRGGGAPHQIWGGSRSCREPLTTSTHACPRICRRGVGNALLCTSVDGRLAHLAFQNQSVVPLLDVFSSSGDELMLFIHALIYNQQLHKWKILSESQPAKSKVPPRRDWFIN